MNLTIPANINSLDLTLWEKLFVVNYYQGQNKPIPNKTQTKSKVDLIRQDIRKFLEELYNLPEEEFQINPDSEEVKREFNNNVEALKTRGEDTKEKNDHLRENNDAIIESFAKHFSDQNYSQYQYIVNNVKNGIYEPSFKCLLLNETLTKIYKKEGSGKDTSKTIIKKRDMHSSIAGHMVINSTTMEYMYDTIEKGFQDKKPKAFANIYYDAIDKYNQLISQKSKISLDNVNTYGKGKWIKFAGKSSDPEGFKKNASDLSALVQDTPWCTKTMAYSQLEEGDFYVFVDNSNHPHIAVKMKGAEIDELRGIKNGFAQELEDDYRDVAVSFLENNKDIENGVEWLEKEEWNARLINYGKMIEAGTFELENVEPLIQDLFFRKDFRNHAGYKNSNLGRLKKVLYLASGKFAEYFHCSEEEICCGDFDVCDIGENKFISCGGYRYNAIRRE